jgi:hypothetical protein
VRGSIMGLSVFLGELLEVREAILDSPPPPVDGPRLPRRWSARSLWTAPRILPKSCTS